MIPSLCGVNERHWLSDEQMRDVERAFLAYNKRYATPSFVVFVPADDDNDLEPSICFVWQSVNDDTWHRRYSITVSFGEGDDEEDTVEFDRANNQNDDADDDEDED